MTTIRDTLARTLLLMRDEIQDGITDDELLRTLTRTEVVITADAETLRSPSAQSAFITTAMLAARSGHKVYLLAPDIPPRGIQPPFHGSGVVSALLKADTDFLPINRFTTETPTRSVDLCVDLGQSRCYEADQTVAISASRWTARFATSGPVTPWDASNAWPFGHSLVARSLPGTPQSGHAEASIICAQS